MFRDYSTKRIVVIVAVISLLFATFLTLLAPPSSETPVTESVTETIIVATATVTPAGECADVMTKGIIDRTITAQNQLSLYITSIDNDTDMTLVAGLMNAHDMRGEEIAHRLAETEECSRDALIATQNLYDLFTASYDEIQAGEFDVTYYMATGEEFWQEYKDAFGEAAARKLSEEISP